MLPLTLRHIWFSRKNLFSTLQNDFIFKMFRTLLAGFEALNLSGFNGHSTIPVPSDLLDNLAVNTEEQINLVNQMLHRHYMLTELLSEKGIPPGLSEAHRLLNDAMQKFCEIRLLIKEVEKHSTSVQGHLHVREDQLITMSQESKCICNIMQEFQKVFGDAMDGIAPVQS